MKKLIPILLLSISLACQHKENQDEHHHPPHEGHEHHKHDGHKNANEHMHETPVSELIKRFESAERNNYQQPDKVLEYLGDLKGKTIMDIGAGSGYFSFRLLAKGAKVIAADVNDEFQAYIQEKKEKDFNNSADLELRKLPFDSPALKPQEADKVLIVNTYHHIENREAYFKQVLEGLKTDGELVVIDFFKKDLPVGPPTDHKISEDDVKAELAKAGFSQINVNTELLQYQYIIRAKK